ncbi:MAG: 2-hydroxychromene-2-carboxylate isomerase [Burkholderiaceae bacterium]
MDSRKPAGDHRLECFFDISSPWTYLCFHNLPAVAARAGVEIRWRPILVGGIFNTINPTVYASREHPVPAKHAYMVKSIGDWARLAGIEIRFPPSVFPVNSVRVMRACVALQDDPAMPAFARAAFEAYWKSDVDISSEAAFIDICKASGLDPRDMLERAGGEQARAGLRSNTDELIGRGGFGSPTMFVDGHDMYFGNDALPLVEAALLRNDGSR